MLHTDRNGVASRVTERQTEMDPLPSGADDPTVRNGLDRTSRSERECPYELMRCVPIRRVSERIDDLDPPLLPLKGH
jgi:hypothetical protein